MYRLYVPKRTIIKTHMHADFDSVSKQNKSKQLTNHLTYLNYTNLCRSKNEYIPLKQTK